MGCSSPKLPWNAQISMWPISHLFGGGVSLRGGGGVWTEYGSTRGSIWLGTSKMHKRDSPCRYCCVTRVTSTVSDACARVLTPVSICLDPAIRLQRKRLLGACATDELFIFLLSIVHIYAHR